MAKIKQGFAKEVENVRPRLADCAYETCEKEALVRVRGDGNSWVNLCVGCYQKWFTPERILNNKHPTDTPAVLEAKKGIRKNIPTGNLVESVPDAFENL